MDINLHLLQICSKAYSLQLFAVHCKTFETLKVQRDKLLLLDCFYIDHLQWSLIRDRYLRAFVENSRESN